MFIVIVVIASLFEEKEKNLSLLIFNFYLDNNNHLTYFFVCMYTLLAIYERVIPPFQFNDVDSMLGVCSLTWLSFIFFM